MRRYFGRQQNDFLPSAMSSLRGEMCLSLSLAQIAAVIYALSNIPGVHLEGYEFYGDCEESYGSYGSYGSYMDFYCLIGERLPATGEVASLQRSRRDIVSRPFL